MITVYKENSCGVL